MKVNGRSSKSSEVLRRGYLRAVGENGKEIGIYVPRDTYDLRKLRGYIEAGRNLGVETVLLFHEARCENRIWTIDSLEADGGRVDLRVELSRHRTKNGKKHDGLYDCLLDYQSSKNYNRKGQIIIPAFTSDSAVAEAIGWVLRGE